MSHTYPIKTFKPDSQAIRNVAKDMTVRWFDAEPVSLDRLEAFRKSRSINSVKGQMIGAGMGQV
jgi:hypothetical protein